MADFIELIGLLAGVFTTFANAPQLIKSWKTKSTHDLSIEWLAFLFIGVILWIFYGLFTESFPVIAANIVTSLLVAGLIFIKLKYK